MVTRPEATNLDALFDVDVSFATDGSVTGVVGSMRLELLAHATAARLSNAARARAGRGRGAGGRRFMHMRRARPRAGSRVW